MIEIWLSSIFLSRLTDCSEIRCTREFKPVCGSDGKYKYFGQKSKKVLKIWHQFLGRTHANQCVLKETACRRRTSIDKIHDGRCGSKSQDNDQVTGPRACPICQEIYQPVCGSDGKTYVILLILLPKTCSNFIF